MGGWGDKKGARLWKGIPIWFFIPLHPPRVLWKGSNSEVQTTCLARLFPSSPTDLEGGMGAVSLRLVEFEPRWSSTAKKPYQHLFLTQESGVDKVFYDRLMTWLSQSGIQPSGRQ
jgi:hypothetical protein